MISEWYTPRKQTRKNGLTGHIMYVYSTKGLCAYARCAAGPNIEWTGYTASKTVDLKTSRRHCDVIRVKGTQNRVLQWQPIAKVEGCLVHS
jgi:hypothetical protein